MVTFLSTTYRIGYIFRDSRSVSTESSSRGPNLAAGYATSNMMGNGGDKYASPYGRSGGKYGTPGGVNNPVPASAPLPPPKTAVYKPVPPPKPKAYPHARQQGNSGHSQAPPEGNYMNSQPMTNGGGYSNG